MIMLYSGTPGSGKSLHMAREIDLRLRVRKKDVIASFPINTDIISRNGKKKIAKFIYCGVEEMTTEYLISYALENHKLGVEDQTLVCIDECQIIFNTREFSRKDRMKWIVFFTQHRKLGYNFLLVSQYDRLIDRQIRCLLEYDVIHRKVNNFGILFLLPIKIFLALEVWYGNRQVISKNFFLYKKKLGAMYDSFMMFDEGFKAYVAENLDRISDYNLDKLGFSKDEEDREPTPNDPEEEEIFQEFILNQEIDTYADMLRDLPDGQGDREVIEREVEEALSRKLPKEDGGDKNDLE